MSINYADLYHVMFRSMMRFSLPGPPSVFSSMLDFYISLFIRGEATSLMDKEYIINRLFLYVVCACLHITLRHCRDTLRHHTMCYGDVAITYIYM